MSASFGLLVLVLSGCNPGVLFAPFADDTGEPDSGEETGTPDDTGADHPSWWGTGEDGTLEVMGRVDLSTWVSTGRMAPDAASYPVATVTATSITTSLWSTGMAHGDEILVIDVQGTEASTAAVGSFAFARVASVDDAVITVEEDLGALLPGLVGQDLAGHDVRVQRVPQYARVTISKAGALTTAAWNGEGGGILAFRASQGVSVDAGGRITVDEAGFAGGATGSTASCDGYQGESLGGPGRGGQCGSPYNEAIGAYAANLGGGGANVTGGGGNHAGGATAGDAWRGSATPPAAGEPYGDAELTHLFLGSGGGGVWYGAGTPGPGGAGGGMVIIGTSTLDASGAESVTALGETALSWSEATSSYGAGGGAGGSILIVADEVNLGFGSVLALGGTGEDTHERRGGAGGEGRIRIDCITCNGEAGGSKAATAALADAANPDPGWSTVPVP